MCALPSLHLSPCGRGRVRKHAGEGGNTAFFLLGTEMRRACKRRAATLTRLLTQPTSPIEGEVALHLSPGGQGNRI